MSTLTQASHQWSSRPADQRFTSLPQMLSFMQDARRRSAAKVVSSRAITVAPVEGDLEGIVVAGPNGAPVAPTHWAFGQLAQRAGAPVGYLRDLPAPLVADCINYGLKHSRSVEEMGVLLARGDGSSVPELRAVTGPNYGRIWNMTIVDALIKRFGDGVTGSFKVPGEFGHDVPVTKDNTTLYASDRDMFVFLADEKNRIEIPNRRDGQSGSMARGFFVWNSEVGKTTLGISTFLFDYVCMNRIVWGAKDYAEVRIRHTAGAPDRWIEEVVPAIEAYANSSTTPITKAIEAARAAKFGNPAEVEEFLVKRFSRTVVGAVKAAHLADEGRPIETLWDVSTGITAYARGIQYQDERVDFEREAGKILQLAA
jgi:hypothetical protein